MVLSRDPHRDEATLALAGRVKDGDRAAFALLVARLQGPLIRFLSLRTGSAEDAEELAQETFARAWAARARYDGRHAYSTWLFTIGRRLAVSHHRRRARATHEPLPDDMDSGELDPLRSAGAREEHENLWALAARVLGEEARAALWLRYVEELQPGEIAVVLGRTGPGVRVLLFRARRRMAAVLEPDAHHTPHAADRAGSDLPAWTADPSPLPGGAP